MSTGLPTDASAGRNARSAATVPAPSSGICSPRASQVSAHWMPRPPAFVTIATRARRRRLVHQQRRHVEHLLERVGANHAVLAKQRVGGRVVRRDERAGMRRGRAGAGDARPLFTATTGLCRVIRRASRPNRRGFPNDSRYRSTTSVRGSSSQ